MKSATEIITEVYKSRGYVLEVNPTEMEVKIVGATLDEIRPLIERAIAELESFRSSLHVPSQQSVIFQIISDLHTALERKEQK